MAGSAQWKRVLISGSNFEVNSLTSSAHFLELDDTVSAKNVIFRDPSSGGFEHTESIRYQTAGVSQVLNVGNNSATHSVVVPDAGISASVMGDPISTSENYQFPVVFKNNTYSYLERTSSINFEQGLAYSGRMTAINNSQIQSGSNLEGPTPDANALFALKGQTADNFALTFDGSFLTNPADSYIQPPDNGDYLEWTRGLPVGTGITASFSIPIYYTGGDQDQEIKYQLRRWTLYADPEGAGEYLDEDEVTVTRGDLGLTNLGSGSLTGSYEIESTQNNPISVGERWQLRIRGHQNFNIGYNNGSTDYNNVGPFEFKITGSTAIPEAQLGGDFSGSFVGDVFGGYSGSVHSVTLNNIPAAQGLDRGDGLLFLESDGSAKNKFTGSAETTMSIRLYPMNTQGSSTNQENKSGLSLAGIDDSSLFNGVIDNGSNTELELTDGLAQNKFGLEFAGSNKEQINIHTATNSALTFTGGALHLDNDLLTGNATSGLTGSFGVVNEGTASVNLYPGKTGQNTSGLAFENLLGQDGKLQLTQSLAGMGLEWGGSVRDDLRIDSASVVTLDNEITFSVVSTNKSLGVSNNVGGPFTPSEIQVKLDGNDTLQNGVMNFASSNGAFLMNKNMTIEGDLVVSGNFIDISDAGVTQIQVDEFETTDQFVLINSGSNTGIYARDNGGFIIQTASLDAGGNASGSAIFGDWGFLGNDLTIGGKSFNQIGWGVTTGKIKWDATSVFGDQSSQSNIGDLTASADYVAGVSTMKYGTAEPGDNSLSFMDNTALANTIGSFYIDSDANPSGNDSNVYIFGIFD